jgi:hypothetical protein
MQHHDPDETRELSPLNVQRLEERGWLLSTRQLAAWTFAVVTVTSSIVGFGYAGRVFVKRMDRMETICKQTQLDVQAIERRLAMPSPLRIPLDDESQPQATTFLQSLPIASKDIP